MVNIQDLYILLVCFSESIVHMVIQFVTLLCAKSTSADRVRANCTPHAVAQSLLSVRHYTSRQPPPNKFAFQHTKPHSSSSILTPTENCTQTQPPIIIIIIIECRGGKMDCPLPLDGGGRMIFGALVSLLVGCFCCCFLFIYLQFYFSLFK